MDCPTAITILAFALIGAGIGLINYVKLFRQQIVTVAGLKVLLRYQYPKNIVTYNLEAQEEMCRDINARLSMQTDRLYKDFLEAHKRLNGRLRWDPFRNSLLNRRVFAYEIARSKLFAANEAGPTTIYINSFIYPDFTAGNCPNPSGGIRST